MNKNPIIAALQNEPMAVAPDREAWFESCLAQLLSHTRAAEIFAPGEDTHMASSEDDGFWPAADDWRASMRPYTVKNGILLIPVLGVLLNRFPWALGQWATGYTYIERALRRGLLDAEVKGIAFICDSPGGEVSGCFELCDKIFAARGQKPLRSFAADRAYSAAYAIACTADNVTAVRTAGLGSIGVVILHLDYSEALSMSGIKATFIKEGQFKTDGNSLEPLSNRAKRRMQTRIAKIMDIFVASVSRNRGLDEKVIRDTEADCFTADEAVQLGLADQIQVFEDAIVAFTEDCATSDGETDMTTQTNKDAVITQADVDAAVAKASESAKAEGVRDGTAAERARVTAIVGSDEAKDRQEAALAIALTSDMTADAAAAVLAKLPKTEKALAVVDPKKGALGAAFAEAMKDSPQVGADGGADGDKDGDKEAKASASILGDYRAATGAKKAA